MDPPSCWQNISTILRMLKRKLTTGNERYVQNKSTVMVLRTAGFSTAFSPRDHKRWRRCESENLLSPLPSCLHVVCARNPHEHLIQCGRRWLEGRFYDSTIRRGLRARQAVTRGQQTFPSVVLLLCTVTMEITVAGDFLIGRSRLGTRLIGFCLVLLAGFACLFAFNWSTTDCVMSFCLIAVVRDVNSM